MHYNVNLIQYEHLNRQNVQSHCHYKRLALISELKVETHTRGSDGKGNGLTTVLHLAGPVFNIWVYICNCHTNKRLNIA